VLRILVLALLILSGCATTPEYDLCIPDERLVEYNIQFCGKPPSRNDLEAYIKAFESSWNNDPILPQDRAALREALDSIIIYWQPYIFRDRFGTRDLLGLTYSKRAGKIHVFVYVPPNCFDMGCTALGHELIHIAYGAIKGDMQADHFGLRASWPAYLENFLDEVRSAYLSRAAT
jgi:hypothetical protein